MPYTTGAGAPTMDDADTRISGTSGVQIRGPLDDPAHQPVAERRFGAQPEVPVGVLLDALERLAGFAREDAIQPVAHAEDLARLDVDVAGRAAGAARGLMQQEPGVGQAESALPRRGDVDQRARARHPPRADHPGLGPDEADQIVDGVAGLHVAALRVDEHRDIAVGLGRQREELARHGGRQALGDLTADDDRARAKQALGDRIVEWRRRALGIGLVEHRVSRSLEVVPARYAGGRRVYSRRPAPSGPWNRISLVGANPSR